MVNSQRVFGFGVLREVFCGCWDNDDVTAAAKEEKNNKKGKKKIEREREQREFVNCFWKREKD